MFICKECCDAGYVDKRYVYLDKSGRCNQCNRIVLDKITLWYKKRENNNMEKQIKMSLETARKLWSQLPPSISDNANAFIYRMLEENFTKEELEGDNGFTWEDSFSGASFMIMDGTVERVNCKVRDSNKGCFKTETQAKSALAFAQLSHIVSKYNSKREYFNCCSMITGDLKISITNIFGAKSEQHLGFYEYKDAETSLRVNNDLWKQYWMI